jgi:hypothetical protein
VVDAPFRAADIRDVVPDDDCSPEDQGATCLAARNIRPPSVFEGDFGGAAIPQAFVDRTGFRGPLIYTDGEARLVDRASRTFVQFGAPGQVGLNINNADRLGVGASGLDLVYNFDRFTAPDATDRRLIPFRYGGDVPFDLVMRFTLFVNAVNVNPGSVAAGRLRLRLADEAGRPFDLVVPLYGTVEPPGPSIARSLVDGRPVVTLAVDRDSLFGRQVTHLPYLQVPGQFRSANPWGYGGVYEFRITAPDLQRSVNAVRELDNRFLAAGGLYQVLGYRIENEVEGPGSLGLNVSDVSLQLARR